jgi:hypothetical protein
MAAAYDVSPKNVEPLKHRFVAAGFAAALDRQPVTKAPRRTSTGYAEAHGIALSCGHAPAGPARWTRRLLADNMVAWDIGDAVAPATIRRT